VGKADGNNDIGKGVKRQRERKGENIREDQSVISLSRRLFFCRLNLLFFAFVREIFTGEDI
jgi:hypothetical protein